MNTTLCVCVHHSLAIIYRVAASMVGGGCLADIYLPRSNGVVSTSVNDSTKYSNGLISRQLRLNHQSSNLWLALRASNSILAGPTGQLNIFCPAKMRSQRFLAVYPLNQISNYEGQSRLEFQKKVYFKNVHPKFPAGGKMSQHLEAMKIGETIDVRGPSGLLEYRGRSNVAVKPDKKSPPNIVIAKKINMIAGGTGITPMLQLVRQVTRDPLDPTQLALIFANQTEEDILLRPELEDIVSQFPDKFKLWYTVDRPTEGWKYSSGFVNAEMMSEHLFPPADDTLTLMCGPPPMINFACQPNLDKLGHSANSRFAY
ncbi:unnamed protein product, partial [Meganyctiphanes norvegica]